MKREVPIGGKSDSDSYCSVIVKSSESESSRSPTNVKGEVPIGGPGHHYCVNAKVIVHAVLSGMISFLPNGTIHGCNHHFALMLFGYSQQELLKKVPLFVHLYKVGNRDYGLFLFRCHIHVVFVPWQTAIMKGTVYSLHMKLWLNVVELNLSPTY